MKYQLLEAVWLKRQETSVSLDIDRKCWLLTWSTSFVTEAFYKTSSIIIDQECFITLRCQPLSALWAKSCKFPHSVKPASAQLFSFCVPWFPLPWLGLCCHTLTSTRTPRLHQTVAMHCIVMWGLSTSDCMVMWGLSLHQTAWLCGDCLYIRLHGYVGTVSTSDCMVMWGLSLHQTAWLCGDCLYIRLLWLCGDCLYIRLHGYVGTISTSDCCGYVGTVSTSDCCYALHRYWELSSHVKLLA